MMASSLLKVLREGHATALPDLGEKTGLDMLLTVRAVEGEDRISDECCLVVLSMNSRKEMSLRVAS